MSGKISVIVPVYNAELFIERCADSVLNQTYRDVELILVNDGSKDGSLAKCYEIAKRDCRVVVLDKTNGGAASARNMGLDHASGEYIGFCDADDFLDLNMYEILLNKLQQENLDTIECTSKVFDHVGNLIHADPDTGRILEQSSVDAIKQIFLRKGNVSLCTRLIRRDIVKNLRIPEERRVEDFYFTICCLTAIKKNVIYDSPFYNCVSRFDSVTRSATGSIYLDALYFYHLAVDLLKEKNTIFPLEQEYYLLKMYYLLAVSSTAEEWRIYKTEMRNCQKDLRKHLFAIGNNHYLVLKEKLGLYMACVDMRLCRLIYSLKNIGKKL